MGQLWTGDKFGGNKPNRSLAIFSDHRLELVGPTFFLRNACHERKVKVKEKDKQKQKGEEKQLAHILII